VRQLSSQQQTGGCLFQCPDVISYKEKTNLRVNHCILCVPYVLVVFYLAVKTELLNPCYHKNL
jgi:hypothetical protein